MSASTTPSSESLERDAAALHARHDHSHGKVDAGEIAIGVIIGRTSEFFDFFVYAIASVVVFPQLIFPFAGPIGGTLLSFAVFALAFLARPLGTALFIAIDQKFGRGAKLTTALFLLGTSTVAVAFLPGYETIGIAAAVLLAVFRIGQGVALGGAWDGLASLLALNAPENRRGWFAMIPQLGAPIGLIVASALFAFFLNPLSAADFLDWGWRYPFFVAFAINVVALFARLRIVVTPSFQKLFETRELQPVPVHTAVKAEGPRIAIGASVACSGVCLTVVEKNADWLAFDVSSETLYRTTLGAWRVGVGINLERPLALGDELGGHMVLGHVDGVARVEASEPVGDSRRLSISAPEALAGFIAAKGSVALDGVSLTVNQVENTVFEVNIIPHTLAVTTLGGLAAGDRVNLEIDILARYVARQHEWAEAT